MLQAFFILQELNYRNGNLSLSKAGYIKKVISPSTGSGCQLLNSGELPPKQFIQFFFFKFEIGGFAIGCHVGYIAVKQAINQHLHFFIS